jgi:quinoprotein relay system zinc metallohydrolase 2
MRRILVPLLLAVLLVSQAVAAGEVEPAPVVEVAAGVFVRQGAIALANAENVGGIANIGFVVGRDAVAVIDTGGSYRDGARLRAAVRAHTGLPIAYVINTHMHPDHVLGNAAFARDRPQFVGHRNLARALAARAEHYLATNHRLIGTAGFAGTEVVTPTTTVEARTVIDLGDRPLELRAYPTAHTDNDLTVLDRRTGTLWTGDLLFVEHVPVVDGSLKGWLAVVDDLADTSAARAVPGHGPTAVSWPQALAAQRRYLSTLADDLRRALAAGQGLRRASEHAGRDEAPRWRLFDDFHVRNATAGYAELEWE